MKSHFPASCKLSKENVDEIFDHCTFIFDTNALLDLYRIPKDTAEKVLSIFESYKDRIRVPYHVSEEYCVDLKDVITTQINKIKEARSNFDNFYKFIGQKRNQPHISKKTLSKLNTFKKAFEQELDEHNDYLWDELRYGYLNNSLVDLLEGLLLDKLEDEKIKEIESSGDERYNKLIPPGYMDAKKTVNKFGDLIIWMEILQYVSTEHKDVVFVTNDWKEDLMEKFDGIEYAARREMIEEFKQASPENNFIIVKLDQFLERVNKYEGEEVGTGLSKEDLEHIKTIFNVKTEDLGIDSLFDSGSFNPYLGMNPMDWPSFETGSRMFSLDQGKPMVFSQPLKTFNEFSVEKNEKPNDNDFGNEGKKED